MNILIGSSQRDEIDDKYKESAKALCNFLITEDNELVWGSASRSIMGICYQAFASQNLPIHGFTNPKYIDELKLLPKANHDVLEDTFLLKKSLFTSADLVIILPGGLGTISELFSYLEEIRSNDAKQKLVIYDEYHHFDTVLLMIDDLVKRNFNGEDIYSYYKVITNLEDFKKYYELIKKEFK